MNYILITLEMIIALSFIIYFYKKKNSEGIYIYTLLAYITSIIISVKNIEIMTIEIPLGIVLMTSIYLLSNILVQEKGQESINKLINLFIISSLSLIPILLLTSSLTTTNPNAIINTYSLMFINKIRIVIITAIMPLLIIIMNSRLYYQLKREKNNILLNSILTSIIIFFIDASLFSIISFTFVIPINKIFITAAVIYVIKIIMTFITTPVLYIMQKIKK